ncbi:polysaccharide deacetylase family protein [Xanthobacter oligotrophicus]|uniref:Chitooligosaccharide deacetylase n=1 Tax=Xanthobacter oligotrophicus TaxID=2607286 RepID=A0ABW7A0W8_9HYPH
MKPLLIVSGILVASAVGAGVAISPMLTSAKAVRDDGPATTQSISQNGPGGQAKGAQGKAAQQAEAVAPAPDPAPAPAVTPRKNYTYKSFNVDGNYIAMTFDDGPNPETTPQLLAILKERGIKATFFVLGNMVAKHPEVLKMISDEGHEIGNHSWSHPQLTRISQAAVEKELGNTSEAIFQVTGKRPMYLRPPYGSMKPTLRAMIEEKYGLTTVNWAVDPNDWKFRDSQKVHDAIIAQVTPGAIVLSHDIYPTTVAAMPRILDELIAKGYKFGTISELIARDKTPKVQLMAALPNGKPQQANQKDKKPKPATASAKPDAKPAKPAANAAPQQRAGGVY